MDHLSTNNLLASSSTATVGTKPSSKKLNFISCPFDFLCDYTLAHVLSFTSFTDATVFASLTSDKIRNRILDRDNNDVEGIKLSHDAFEKNEVKNNNIYFGAQIDQDEEECQREQNYDHDDRVIISPFHHLWKTIYQRHLFAPPTITENDKEDQCCHHAVDYYAKCCKQKRELFKNLVNERRVDESFEEKKTGGFHHHRSAKRTKSCFSSLPNRRYHFLPVTPKEEEASLENTTTTTTTGTNTTTNADNSSLNGNIHSREHEDPPPVDFPCTSYVLLSPSTSSEYVFLDPFTGTVSVYDDIMHDSIESDECLIERAKEKVINSSSSYKTNDIVLVEEDIIKENKMKMLNTPNSQPKEVLFGIEDYFHIDLSQYFIPRSTSHHHTMDIDSMEDTVVVDWLGVDVHTMINPQTLDVDGTMIAAVRVFDMDAIRVEDEQSCTEILAWKRLSPTTSLYNHHHNCMFDNNNVQQIHDNLKSFSDEKLLCRIEGSIYYVDICPIHEMVYAAFSPEYTSRGEIDRHDLPNNQQNHVHRNNWENNQPDNDDDDNDDDDDDDDDDDVSIDDTGAAIIYNRKIKVFPLLRDHDDKKHSNIRPFFPKVEHTIVCQNGVTCFIIDPTGKTILVGTETGSIEIWDVNPPTADSHDVRNEPSLHMKGKPIRTHVKTVSSELKQKFSKIVPRPSNSMSFPIFHTSHPSEATMATLSSEDGTSALQMVGDSCEITELTVEVPLSSVPQHLNEEEMPRFSTEVATDSPGSGIDELINCHSLPFCEPGRKISEIIIPRHLSIDQAGFVTLQHHNSEGTTISLWQHPLKNDMYTNINDFQLVSLINLPLSPQRRPQISYDGKRLIVFGQDHIGVIILVYHVLSTLEDKRAFEERVSPSDMPKSNHISEDAGGVINLNVSEPHIQFVNRIRHAGLGGLELYDNMFLSANERFIVVNTKTGDLVGVDKKRGAIEGLFIIDLEEHE